jgi:hypothetical protein
LEMNLETLRYRFIAKVNIAPLVPSIITHRVLMVCIVRIVVLRNEFGEQ